MGSVFPPGKHSGFGWAAAAFASLGGDRGDPWGQGAGDRQGGGYAAIAPWCWPRLSPVPVAVISSGPLAGTHAGCLGTGTATETAPPAMHTGLQGDRPPQLGDTLGTLLATGMCGVPRVGAEPWDTGSPCLSTADPSGAQASPSPVPSPVPAWPWAGAAIVWPAAGWGWGGPGSLGTPGKGWQGWGLAPPGPPAPRRPYNKVLHQHFYYLCSGWGAPPLSPSWSPGGLGSQLPPKRLWGGVCGVAGPGRGQSGSSRASAPQPRHSAAPPAPAARAVAAEMLAGRSKRTALPGPPARGIPPPHSDPTSPACPPSLNAHIVSPTSRETPLSPNVLQTHSQGPSLTPGFSPHILRLPPAPGSPPAPRHAPTLPSARRVPGETLGRAGAATSASPGPSSPLKSCTPLSSWGESPQSGQVGAPILPREPLNPARVPPATSPGSPTSLICRVMSPPVSTPRVSPISPGTSLPPNNPPPHSQGPFLPPGSHPHLDAPQPWGHPQPRGHPT